MISNKLNENTKIKVSIFISIGVIAVTLVYIFWINFHKDVEQLNANEGVLDLAQWDMDKNVLLQGEWAFYPHVLLTPEDDFDEYENIKEWIGVPGPWNTYLTEGSGTYRLKINLPQDDTYGIKTRTIRTASRIFINDDPVVNTGNPSVNIEDFIPESKYKIGFVKSDNQELELIVNVSNYEYSTGGILVPIEFGRFESILSKDRIDRGIDGITVIGSLILGVYFLITYLHRGKDKELLYFGLTSIFMSIYVSTFDEQLLNLIVDYDFVSRTQIQMTISVLLFLSVLRFTFYFFEDFINKRVINKKTINIVTGLTLIGVITGLFADTIGEINVQRIFISMISVISFLIIFAILIQSIIKKAHALEYIIVVTSALFSCFLAVIMKISFQIELGHIFLVLIIIIVGSTSISISNKLQLDYRMATSLSKKLIKDDRLKDEFLARASHELRTPLHVILNSLQALIEGNKGSLNSKQQESLFFINREGKRLSRLVDDLLNATNIKEGEVQLRIQSMNVYRIIENILREMAFLIPEDKDIQLINNIPEDLPMIHSDPDKFIQIIYNLINNSIRYTKVGTIEVSAIVESEKIKFRVKDTGIGIKEEDKEEIFKVFYKVDEDDDNMSMGLGLPITKQLVEVLGGEIAVASTYGKGSSFTFMMPMNQGKILTEASKDTKIVERSEPALEQSLSFNRDKPTILIVDDRLANQKVLMDILEIGGYNLLIANNGQEAIEMLEKNKVDLVVLDFMLPDIPGDMICSRIREKYNMTELPIIILTASGRDIDFKKSFDCGANDFIKKPADAQELMTRIHSLLAMKKSVAEDVNKELQYFYSQISPHFLHNTLNTIIGLSYENTEKAREALVNLSIYFRGKLDLYKDEGVIPLTDELELVEAYLDIEKLRYEDRLNVQINMAEDFKIMIPPLTIQPLVENSICHGIAPKEEAGNITINVRRDPVGIIISIEDDGVGMSKEKQEEILSGNSHRLGFKNVMEKIKIIKGATLELESKELKGTIIKIIMPQTADA